MIETQCNILNDWQVIMVENTGLFSWGAYS